LFHASHFLLDSHDSRGAVRDGSGQAASMARNISSTGCLSASSRSSDIPEEASTRKPASVISGEISISRFSEQRLVVDVSRGVFMVRQPYSSHAKSRTKQEPQTKFRGGFQQAASATISRLRRRGEQSAAADAAANRTMRYA